MSVNTKIELLAPVGTAEALRAAVQNGADAVYLGGKQFSARQYAQNFDSQELKEVVRYAHLYGVRVYIAVNTLIDNEEFTDFMDYIYSLYLIDVDAIILQDLGAAYAAHNLLPEMDLHASTQMTISNASGARFVHNMGFSRVVLAREVSIDNIMLIGKAEQIPLEVFVHGALCVSYSGQCLMSSMIGGRSGNRGRCAQPCRLPYTLVDSDSKEIATGHLLSPKDLRMIEHLELLQEAGVVSLKVEGRMKRAEYVAVVIRNYRDALELIETRNNDESLIGKEYRPEPRAIKELFQIFNRDFTDGYYLKKPGAHLMSYQRPNNRGLFLGRVVAYNIKTDEVILNLEESLKKGDGYQIWVSKGGRIAGEVKSLKQDGQEIESAETGQVAFPITKGRPQIGDRVFKTLDIELMEKARDTFISSKDDSKFPLDMRLEVKMGEPVRLIVEEERGHVTCATGDYLVEKAKKNAFTIEMAEKQLGRLGNTVFYLRRLELDSGENLMVPASELNSIRRRAVEEIEEKILNNYTKPELLESAYRQRVGSFVKEVSVISPNQKKKTKLKKPRIAVVVGDIYSLKAAVEAGAQIVYFGGEKLRSKKGIGTEHFRQAVNECHNQGAEAVLMLPRVYHEDKSEDIKRYCEIGHNAGVDGLLVGNPGTVQLALDLGLPSIRGDYTLNIFNNYSVQFLSKLGLELLTLSPELTLKQIINLRSSNEAKFEILVHGRLPLMITEQCTIGINLGEGHVDSGCKMPCTKGGFGLRDRMNMIFPIESDEYCRMHVYNPKTLSLLDRLPEILDSGINVLRIEAKREEAQWVKKVTALYHEEIQSYIEMGDSYKFKKEKIEILNELSPAGFTSGHYYRGVL
ncbi:MAG: peptidase U32 [Firmicutes bacterium HGW-Firmicutes-12]|jgi:putative protease|nr:MAG: peptidase U32 [Firmicutes bacterium HGW-Firmicutes-12]